MSDEGVETMDTRRLRKIAIFLWVLTALAGLILVGGASQAQAIGMCGKRADIVKALTDKYSETRRATAIAGNINLVEVFASKAGTWSIIITSPQGSTCFVGTGSGWEDLPAEIEGKNL